MRKFMSMLFALTLAACSGGTSITGPESNEAPTTGASAPVAQATPAPQPVDGQTPTASVINFYPNATFEAFNNSGDPKEFTAFITSFDDQVTPLTPPGVVKQLVAAGKSWNYSFSRTCVQADVEGDGVFGAAFYGKNGQQIDIRTPAGEAAIKECRCTPTWQRDEEYETVYGEWVVEGCSKSRTVTHIYTETQTCTNATRKIEVPQPAQVEDVEGETNFSLGTLSYSTYTPGYTLYKYDGRSGLENDCQNDGGTFYSSKDGRENVCYTMTNHGEWWEYDNNDYANRYDTDNVPASGGNPISGSASVSGSGTWKLVLKATNPGDYNKDIDTEKLGCGERGQLNVSYDWIGHNSDKWFLQLFHNNVLVATSPIVNNPSN